MIVYFEKVKKNQFYDLSINFISIVSTLFIFFIHYLSIYLFIYGLFELFIYLLFCKASFLMRMFIDNSCLISTCIR